MGGVGVRCLETVCDWAWRRVVVFSARHACLVRIADEDVPRNSGSLAFSAMPSYGEVPRPKHMIYLSGHDVGGVHSLSDLPTRLTAVL